MGGQSTKQTKLQKAENQQIARQNATENDLRKQKFGDEMSLIRRMQGGSNGGLNQAPTNRTLGS